MMSKERDDVFLATVWWEVEGVKAYYLLYGRNYVSAAAKWKRYVTSTSRSVGDVLTH